MSKSKTEKVTITPAKGRPMLHWVGKRPLTSLTAFPAQHIETFDPTASGDIETNKLFHGDNKEVLAYMLANGYRGKVDLIYADPPFNTGVDNYVRNVRLRKMKIAGIDGEPISFMEQIQYENYYFPDIYLQFLFDRLKLMYELLSESGNLFLRMDHHYNHMARCILDEVFGVSGYKNEIAVSRTRTLKGEEGRFHAATESVYFYAKSSDSTFNGYHISIPKEQWQWLEMHMTGERKNKDLLTIEVMGRKFKAPNGRRWVLSQSSIDDAVKKGLVKIDEEKNRPLFLNKHYSPGSNWTDIPGYSKKFNYPTENSEELLERVIISASNPGDIVLDCFVGSGTTAAVAQKLGRRWIGCDINKGSIQTTSKRLQKIILDQIEEQDKKSKRPKLIEDEEEIKPASLAFSVCRVNDYDLQIQHNEAVNLACEHIGIERKKTDTFFDGTFGKNLVKIIPFNHPLSPVDLEEIKKELEARPDEERAITVVCLGIELAAKAWVEEWNRLRKGHNAVNKIDVIELRSDAKYGGFIKHEPAKAKINFARKKDAVAIEIEDFISPTIIQRLQQQAGILKPKIVDWRSMVDCVMMDTNYDGKVFNINLSDVPEKRDDLVKGKYVLDGLKEKSRIAVKIIDMLGEEVLTVKEI